MMKLLLAMNMIVWYLVAAFAFAAWIIAKETPEENEMSTLDILTALAEGGMSPVGACAMGGNMMAESAMKSINLQDRCQKKLGHTDESYTEAVDGGYYTREQFANDGAGYGLCQWTDASRKKSLWAFAETRGKSIGDGIMQAKFCLLELMTTYSELNKYLHTTTDLYTATSRICKEYERPAVNNVDVRYGYAQKLYADYGAMLETMQNAECIMQNDTEPPAYIMGTVRTGEHTPEACFLMAQLKRLGYDVLWLGLDACLRDFQQKRGLEADGVCGEKTWREVLR